MKRVVFSLGFICLLFGLDACKGKRQVQNVDVEAVAVENSRDNLNWAGSYSGVLPCADCEGILTQITLNADNSFQISWQYQDKDDEIYGKSGTFRWNDEGNTIILEDPDEENSCSRYKVCEKYLLHLDMEGNVITGEFADNYMIHKVSD